MHRRDLMRCSVSRLFLGGLVLAISDLRALEPMSWSSSVDGLRLGLRVDIDKGNSHVVVFLNNTSPVTKEVFVSEGMVKRIDFVAVAPDRKECLIRQRDEYVPCAGLCHWPLIENLGPGQSKRLEFATKDLIYLPDRAPIVELGSLLSRGYALRASFTVTDKDLEEAMNRDSFENPWRGRLVAPEVHPLDQK